MIASVVQPGLNPSQHLHQIVGGDAFNVTMDIKTYDVPKESSRPSCTSALATARSSASRKRQMKASTAQYVFTYLPIIQRLTLRL
jgi:hypothetical protein